MSKGGRTYDVGRGKPPRKTSIESGKSGNPKGRPKGSKNFATVFAKELGDKVPINENGRRRRVSKREVIAKQVVNQAAGGNLKAVQTLFNETRHHEEASQTGVEPTIFDTQHDQLVIADIVKRIRLMDEEPTIARPPEVVDKSNRAIPNPKRKESKT